MYWLAVGLGVAGSRSADAPLPHAIGHLLVERVTGLRQNHTEALLGMICLVQRMWVGERLGTAVDELVGGDSPKRLAAPVAWGERH